MKDIKELCERVVNLNTGCPKAGISSAERLAKACLVMSEALEFYSDASKWNVSEPMKTFGWTPAVFAKEALAKSNAIARGEE